MLAPVIVDPSGIPQGSPCQQSASGSGPAGHGYVSGHTIRGALASAAARWRAHAPAVRHRGHGLACL